MIYLDKSVELHNLSIGNKLFAKSCAGDIHCGLLNLGVSHLACYSALPYQLVKTSFLHLAFNGGSRHVGRTDGLVSLLCTLRLSVELARLAIFVAPQLANLFLAAVDAEFREVDRVGTHIRYHSVFIQMLGYRHCLGNGESQFACRLLLQCGCSERRSRRTF